MYVGLLVGLLVGPLVSIEFDGEHVFVRLLECVRPCPTVRNDIVTPHYW